MMTVMPKLLGRIVGAAGVLLLAVGTGYTVWLWDRQPETPNPGWLTLRLADFGIYPANHIPIIKTIKVIVPREIIVFRDIKAAQHDRVAQTLIHSRYHTLIKEVPRVLSPQVDRRYPVPWGAIRLFNAGATGAELSSIKTPAGESDDSPSTFTASDLSTGTLKNDEICKSNSQRLIDLQAYNRANAVPVQ